MIGLPIRSRTRQEYLFSSHLSNIILKKAKENKIKGNKSSKLEGKKIKLFLFTDDMILYGEHAKDTLHPVRINK